MSYSGSMCNGNAPSPHTLACHDASCGRWGCFCKTRSRASHGVQLGCKDAKGERKNSEWWVVAHVNMLMLIVIFPLESINSLIHNAGTIKYIILYWVYTSWSDCTHKTQLIPALMVEVKSKPLLDCRPSGLAHKIVKFQSCRLFPQYWTCLCC